VARSRDITERLRHWKPQMESWHSSDSLLLGSVWFRDLASPGGRAWAMLGVVDEDPVQAAGHAA
jgi:hypothetical protein